MGIFEILTIALIFLKLTGTLDLTWLQVFAPKLFAVSLVFFQGIVEGIQEEISKAKEKND